MQRLAHGLASVVGDASSGVAAATRGQGGTASASRWANRPVLPVAAGWSFGANGAICGCVMKLSSSLFCLVLAACASRAAAPSDDPTSMPGGVASESEEGGEGEAAPEVSTESHGATSTDGTASPGDTKTPPPLSDAEKARLSLPEVVVENVGLHIGGESNSPESKRPFITALEKQFESFRLCYRFVERPGKGGVIGVDLMVPREGGAPNVRQVRTTMAGEEFKGCMVAAFSEASFEPPRKPVVFSYSVKFSLKGATGSR